MQKRALGRSGISVAPFCLGGNVFGWTADEKTSFAILDAFLDAGFDFVDTADVYSAWGPGHSGGESETVIGKWFEKSGKRERVILATKVGMWGRHSGLKAANIVAACEDSLKRLKTDYIDLYQSHRDDPQTPQDETQEAYGKLIKAGKVRAIGASNFDAVCLASAEQTAKDKHLPRYDSLQPHYNLVERDFEKDLQPLCVKEEIGVIPYFALAAGFLTGKYRKPEDAEGRARGGMVGKYITPANLALIDRLDKVAHGKGATIAEVAIAWLRDRPAVTAPIASATSVEQLQSLLRGATLPLSKDDLALIA